MLSITPARRRGGGARTHMYRLPFQRLIDRGDTPSWLRRSRTFVVRVSGGCTDRCATSHLEDDGGPDPSACAPFRVQARGCHLTASPSVSGERKSRSPATTRPADFESVPAPRLVHSPSRLSRPMRMGGRWRRTEIPTPSALKRPSGFQPEPAPRPVHPPERRAENSNPTASRAAHSLAARPDPRSVHSP